MSQEIPDDEIVDRARLIASSDGAIADPTGTASEQLNSDLDKVEENGISLAELFERNWERLEVETGAGRIIFKRNVDNIDDESLAVESSEDPSLKEGDLVMLEGSSMTGTWIKQVIGPGARLAFKKQKLIHYKIGEKTTDETMTITQEDRDKYVREQPQNFRATEDGLDAVLFIPKPQVTEYVAHALTVRQNEGQDESEYLF